MINLLTPFVVAVQLSDAKSLINLFQILRLEFTHYDFKLQGTISAKDFALSMVASADINQINRFLDRVDELENYPHLQDKHFTLEVGWVLPTYSLSSCMDDFLFDKVYCVDQAFT